MDVNKLLKPKSMAVVGASEKEGFGGDTCRIILQYKKDLSRVYFVNPKRDTVFDRKCYHNLSEIDDNIDMIIVCTPKRFVNDILKEASQKGCGGAVVFASGYGETGAEGKKDQQELKELCDQLGIALMGPNCAGFANYTDDVFSFAFLTEKRERKGNIGLISQSGQICLSALDSPELGFSYIISSGNSIQVTVEEYLDFLVDDDSTKVVCAYVEGIKKPKIFVNALKKAALNKKPIILLKSGRSEKSSQLAASHTGSMAGSDKSFDAILKKYGAIRVNDPQELFAAGQLFSRLKTLPKGTKYASLNVSGGEALITADTAHLAGVEFAEISQKAKDELKAMLPFYATVNNPLDMTATLAYDPEKLAKAMEILMNEDEVGAVIMGYTLTKEIIDTTIKCLIDGIEKVVDKPFYKPVIWMNFVSHTPNEEQAKRLEDLSIPLLPPAMYGMKILKGLNDFINYTSQDKRLDFRAKQSDINAEYIGLSESQSMEEMRSAGLSVPVQTVISDELKLSSLLDDIKYPLVMKIDSPDILHKSDVGGVVLNISNKSEGQGAYRQILDSAKKHCPDAHINGVLVKEMLPQGKEFIIGVTVDEQFGPFVMVGFGGVFVEVFKDVQLYPAPVSKSEALNMLKGLKAFKLLNGYRGDKKYDVDALTDFIVKISEYAFENVDDLKELDINPLFVFEEGKGVAMADALVVKKK